MRKNSFQILLIVLLLAMIGLTAQAQDKVMQVHSGGDVVYAINTSLVDSVVFKTTSEDIENPLVDLPWLKAIVNEINLTIQNGNPLSVSIYQCVYSNEEIGFLVDMGNMKPFYNWNGKDLCIMGGVAGETCTELNIVDRKLIWGTNE